MNFKAKKRVILKDCELFLTQKDAKNIFFRQYCLIEKWLLGHFYIIF